MREKRREAGKKGRGANKRGEARKKGARREQKARGATIRLSLFTHFSRLVTICLQLMYVYVFPFSL